jgi:ABC-type Na+ efflux pump permease subunit
MTYPVAEAELALESPIANTLSRVASITFVFSIPMSPVVMIAGSAICEEENLRYDLPGNYLAARSTSQRRPSGAA